MLKKFLSSLFLLFYCCNCWSYTFQGCTEQQRNILTKSIERAKFYSKLAIGENDPSIFIKWMGFNEINDIKSSYAKINDTIDSKNIDFSCNCEQNMFAVSLVSSNVEDTEHQISICKKFWRANLNGKDSQAGTIVHELSHFKDIVGTEDFFIKPDECLSAAKEKFNQLLTIQNANSYEYLVEDLNDHHNNEEVHHHRHNHIQYHHHYPILSRQPF